MKYSFTIRTTNGEDRVHRTCSLLILMLDLENYINQDVTIHIIKVSDDY